VLAEEIPKTQRVDLGNVIASGGSQGRAALGGRAAIAWHPYSATPLLPPGGFSADSSLDAGAVLYTLELEPMEAYMGMAAPQISLPGRIEDVRSRLSGYTAGPAAATTSAEPSLSQKPVSDMKGYPEWMLEDLMKEFTAKKEAEARAAEAARLAQLIADKEKREALLRAQTDGADAATALPMSSQHVLLNSRWPKEGAEALAIAAVEKGIDSFPDWNNESNASAVGMTPLGKFSQSCRNVVTTLKGDVIGALIGDCVRVDVKGQMRNSIELCVPVLHDVEEFNSSYLAERFGIVFDFAVREQVPYSYNITEPPALWSRSGDVLGKFGTVAWEFASGPEFGRLPVGWSKFTALGQNSSLQRGGSRLCSKVYDASKSYCPIVRLDVNLYYKIDRIDPVTGYELPPLDASCPQLDGVLGTTHFEQVGYNQSIMPPYQPIEMQAVQLEQLAVYQERVDARAKEELENSLLVDTEANKGEQHMCEPGYCMAYRSRGYEVVETSVGGSDCMVMC